MASPPPPEPKASHWLLRRADQAAVAGLVLFALVAMALYWVAHGGLRGRLIEIDRASSLIAEFKVDINSAQWPELSALPDIGETLAKRIVEYRQQHGPFSSVDDLRHIRGIGPRILERLRPYVLVGSEQATDKQEPIQSTAGSKEQVTKDQ